METIDKLILGAGFAGLGAAHSFSQKGYKSVILEKESTYGGLCGNFIIDGFRFDRFVHLSFSKDETVNALLKVDSVDVLKHSSNPFNLYKGIWIKHPAQNNLYPLSDDEKQKVITDFLNRPKVFGEINNYEEWLRLQFGNYFAEHFPMVYTRKYWMCEAKELETKWVGSRFYQPSVEEVIQGANTSDTPITYYAKEMRYPAKGGYSHFVKDLAEAADIRYNEEIVEINSEDRVLSCKNGNSYKYNNIFSSLPLPEIIKLLNNTPRNVIDAAGMLRYTSGYHISIGLKTKNIPPYLWWYIYDEDILPARVYSPSLKSPDNVPTGCSSLQMELFCKKEQYSETEMYNGSVQKLIDLDIIKEEDILFVHYGFEKYANVTFNHNIYKSREIIRTYLDSIDIYTIGRFGEWDYLWSDQSLLSGIRIADKFNNI